MCCNAIIYSLWAVLGGLYLGIGTTILWIGLVLHQLSINCKIDLEIALSPLYRLFVLYDDENFQVSGILCVSFIGNGYN